MAGSIVRFFDLASVKHGNLAKDLAALEAQLADSALEAKEQLVSLCAAWFANSNREAIKCRALHALGSIFVREPKLMLNKAFIDIMKKNLAPDAAIMPQLQVLKNLQEHFVQEEADLVARTLAQSQQCESNLNSELVSDASASLIQHMHFLILESSLSPSPRIREQAVKLVKIIIHRGLTASHLWYCFFMSRSIRMSQSLCIYKILKKHARTHTYTNTHSIPYLVAQLCREDSTAKDAMRMISAFHQRETSLFTPGMLWDGVEKAFRICSSAKDLPLEAFAGAFRLIASNDKEKANKIVRHFLAMAMSSFEHLEHFEGKVSANGRSKKQNTLEFKHYVAKFLVQLPFQSMDSVLILIKIIQDRSSVLGGSCMEELGTFLAATADEDSGPPDTGQLKRWIVEAQSLSILVQLDKFLQETYSIKPDRVRKFLVDSTTMDKNSVKEAVLKERIPFDIVIHFADAFQSTTNAMMPTQEAKKELFVHYRNLRDLMRGNFATDAVEDVTDQVPSHLLRIKYRIV